MPERTLLLILSVLFFAFLAKDIAVPAVVLSGLAMMRTLATNGFSPRFMKGATA